MLFREVDTRHHNAAWNMAMDQVLLELQKKTGPTLRFLSFSSPCVLVGYFQSVEQEVRRGYCEEEGIEINRRITGGGAIFFDPSQLGWEIIASRSDFPYKPGELYRLFGEAVAEGLRAFGLPAEFKPRNDIEVNGRKISGMGGTSLGGSFLFQGTLLVEDTVTRMLHALRVPIEKLKPKEIDSVRERVTSLERELGRVPEREALKEALREAMGRRLGIEVVPGELSTEEMERHEEQLRRFAASRWIQRVVLPVEKQGMLNGVYRCDAGTIKANVVVNATQRMIRSTYITGDFFCAPPGAIYDLERLLKNIPFDEKLILDTIDEFFALSSATGVGGEDIKHAFREIFSKWEWVKMGLPPQEANRVFAVNVAAGERFSPEVFLLPYCAKDTACGFRHSRDCLACGMCTIGDAYELSHERGMEPITILSFEDLMDTFEELKGRGVTDYIGCCCEAFYVKHQKAFRNCGLRGLLLDIENSTCYELGKAKEAYLGRFESQTDLNMDLVRKVVDTLSVV